MESNRQVAGTLVVSFQELQVRKAEIWNEAKELLSRGLVKVEVTSSGQTVRFFLDPEEKPIKDLEDCLQGIPKAYLR